MRLTDPAWIIRFGIFYLIPMIWISAFQALGQSYPIPDNPLQNGKDTSRTDSGKTDIGYGGLYRHEVSFSMATAESGDFNRRYINSPLQFIKGKIAGLAITRKGGNPNGSYYTRFRGLNTINANAQPLIVIDGIPDADPDNVDPNDIESMVILKDGTGESIYGVRGSEGVILIRTKKGSNRGPKAEYHGFVTRETVAKNTPVMNATEWKQLSGLPGYEPRRIY